MQDGIKPYTILVNALNFNGFEQLGQDCMEVLLYPSRIGFRFSEHDFTRNLDLSQSQNPRLDTTKALVLFNRKIKISGKLLP